MSGGCGGETFGEGVLRGGEAEMKPRNHKGLKGIYCRGQLLTRQVLKGVGLGTWFLTLLMRVWMVLGPVLRGWVGCGVTPYNV